MWDASGKYLYFLASTDYGLNTGWLDMTSYDRPVTRALYLALLPADEPSPFLPRSDEEGGAEDESDDAEDAEGGRKRVTAAWGDGVGGRTSGDGASRSSSRPRGIIDFEGIARIVGRAGTSVRRTTRAWRSRPARLGVRDTGAGGGFEGEATLLKYTVEEREAEDFLEQVRAGVFASCLRAAPSPLLMTASVCSTVRAPTGTSSAPSSRRGGDGQLDLGGMRVRVEPKAEYAQMLRDGWRFMRDFLYVDNQHGAPWDDVWDWYSAWLPDVRHRSDFNHLLDMLSGEIAVGHSYVRGGDYPDLDNPRTGSAGRGPAGGADGFYRIARIYERGRCVDTRTLPGRSPCRGWRSQEGDYLLAIDGAELRRTHQSLPPAGGHRRARTITLTVSSSPTSGRGTRHRRRADCQRVLPAHVGVGGGEPGPGRRDERAGGSPTSGSRTPSRNGYQYFNRMYYAQQDREGAVIDERNNGGGSAADYIVDMLDRELTGYFNSPPADRKPWTQPMAGLFGPKVMVINERAGSGGDLLPYLFRFRGVGPLVGTRRPGVVWSGHLGHAAPHRRRLVFVAPRGGFFDVNGEWAVEGEGVAPDIEVRNDPAPVIAGGDPQLEAAVREALRLLETDKVELEQEPSPPARWRRPIR